MKNKEIIEVFQFAVTTKNKTSNLTNQITLNSKDLYKLVEIALNSAREDERTKVMAEMKEAIKLSIVSCPRCKQQALRHGTVKGMMHGEYLVGYYCPHTECELYRVLFVAEQDAIIKTLN